MKISLLTAPYFHKPGGGMIVLYEYANRLAQRGHTVHLLHGAPSADAVRRYSWAAAGPANPPSEYWFDHDPRVVMRHVPVLSADEIPAGEILIKGQPLLPSLPKDNGTAVGLIQGVGVFPREVEQAELSAPLSKIGVSKWLCDLVREAGSRERDIAYVPNGVDHSIFRVVHTIESRSPCIAMLWAPIHLKGFDVGLAALDLVRARIPTLRVILFGVWPRTSTIPDWIEYVENPSRQRLADVYNQASVFLNPSRLEGFSLCGIEALACGCALVCTDLPGMRDYAEHETTALLSPIGDAAALAENACRLLEDDARRCALAEAGRCRSLQFDWDRTIDLLEESLVRFREADLAQ